jgi:hypothetical protein
MILEAGDHNGSTFYQHQGFVELVRGNRETAEVGLEDGMMSVIIGMAAQRAMNEHRVVQISEYLA